MSRKRVMAMGVQRSDGGVDGLGRKGEMPEPMISHPAVSLRNF